MKEAKYHLIFGNIHTDIEYLLIDGVSILKDKNSSYWINYTEPGLHAEPLHPDTIVESNGGFSNILERLKKIYEKIKNEDVKKDLKNACDLLQYGIDNHDIEKLFNAHEIIHDYDYFVVNSPLKLNYAPADWQGIYVYFGRVSII